MMKASCENVFNCLVSTKSSAKQMPGLSFAVRQAQVLVRSTLLFKVSNENKNYKGLIFVTETSYK